LCNRHERPCLQRFRGYNEALARNFKQRVLESNRGTRRSLAAADQTCPVLLKDSNCPRQALLHAAIEQHARLPRLELFKRRLQKSRPSLAFGNDQKTGICAELACP